MTAANGCSVGWAVGLPSDTGLSAQVTLNSPTHRVVFSLIQRSAASQWFAKSLMRDSSVPLAAHSNIRRTRSAPVFIETVRSALLAPANSATNRVGRPCRRGVSLGRAPSALVTKTLNGRASESVIGADIAAIDGPSSA